MSHVFPVKGYAGTVSLHWGSFEGASDIFAPQGTPVVSMCDGLVDLAGFDSTGGNAVLITGDDGLEYYYAHGDRAPKVKKGERVAAGAELFGVGNTGNAASIPGFHLHIGIGHGIMNGTGPTGGAGRDFDAVGLLRDCLATTRIDPLNEIENDPNPPYRVVGTDGAGLNVRKTPSASGAKVTALPEGAVVRSLDRAWRPIKTAAGVEGWAADQFLAVDGIAFRVSGTDGAGLNLRKQPTTKSAAVATLAEGTRVEAVDRAWRPVRAADGSEGWAANQFLAPS
ncbi:MAG: SH3 domain-containing protein [Chloroflexota bacterium]